jgi:phosphoglycolate phosphatase
MDNKTDMKYDAIIFDIDGTLWSASAGSTNGWNSALASVGSKKRITIQDIESVTGKPYNECVDALLPGEAGMHPELLGRLAEHEVSAIKNEGGIFYPDVIDGIKKLAEKIPVCLVSNCQNFYMDLFLEFAGFKSFITDYDCYGMSGVSKGEMLKNMIGRNKLDNPVYIGDTSGDEKAAKEAGADFIYVSYGFGKPENECKKSDTFAGLMDYLMARIKISA